MASALISCGTLHELCDLSELPCLLFLRIDLKQRGTISRYRYLDNMQADPHVAGLRAPRRRDNAGSESGAGRRGSESGNWIQQLLLEQTLPARVKNHGLPVSF